MDCLIVAYSEPSRSRERLQFFDENLREEGGWGRFLRLTYSDFEGDIILPNHLAGLAKGKRLNGKLEKDDEGFFKREDFDRYTMWKVPTMGGLFLYQYLKQPVRCCGRRS